MEQKASINNKHFTHCHIFTNKKTPSNQPERKYFKVKQFTYQKDAELKHVEKKSKF